MRPVTKGEPVMSDCLALKEPGPPRSLVPSQIVVPPPQSGEIRLEVQACGLNPVDWKIAASGVPDWTWPHVPGLDIVGRVESVGPDEDDAWVGKLVAVHHDLRRQGGLAQYAVVDTHMAAPVPTGLGPVTAAAVPCPGLTAAQAVERTHLSRTDRMLVIGAGGSVGTYATQLGVLAGAHVTAVAGSADVERLRQLGAAEVVDYRTGSLGDIAPGPFDVVIDAVGSDGATAATLLDYEGRIASVARPDLARVPPFTTAPTAVELALGAVYTFGSAADRVGTGKQLRGLLDLVADDRLQPPPIVRGGLSNAPGLFQAMADGELNGKLVISVPD